MAQPGFGEREEKSYKSGLPSGLAPSTSRIELVPGIPRTERGKFPRRDLEAQNPGRTRMKPHIYALPSALTPDEPSSVAPMPADDPEVQRIPARLCWLCRAGRGRVKVVVGESRQRGDARGKNAGAGANAGLRGFCVPDESEDFSRIGCGQGRVSGELAAGAASSLLSGVDLLPDRIESARRACPLANLRVADARSLPFAAGSFDLVAAFTVFSSVLDPEIARNIAGKWAGPGPQARRRGGLLRFQV